MVGGEVLPDRLGSLGTSVRAPPRPVARPNISSSGPETENSVPVSPTPVSIIAIASPPSCR